MTSKQLDRLVNRDFPWLWAIRPDYDTVHNQIRVVNVRRRPSFLRQQAQPADAEFEVWCKLTCDTVSHRTEAVFRVVDGKPAGNITWGEAIVYTMRSGFTLDAVTTVGKTQCGCPRITLYRSSKRSLPLGFLLGVTHL